MAILNVGGTDLPPPTGLTVSIQDIVKADRNANGTMIMELIAVKRKIEMQWAYLTAAQLSALLTAVDPLFFEVTYPDPQDGTDRSGTFYKGDRSCGMYMYNNGNPVYKDVKFNVIER